MNNPNTELSVTLISPKELLPAPWNPNRLDPEAEAKLDKSLSRLGMFKPVVCRTVNGKLQILGGHYRVQSAMRIGLDQVPVVNLGEVNDERAKEITLIDNGRYGRDDATAFASIIEDLGDPLELSGFMPFDIAELDAISASTKINLDSLDLDEDDAPPVEKQAKTTKTHDMMRFRVSLGDAKKVSEVLMTIMNDQGLNEEDDLTNAGDALTWLVNDWLENRS